MAKDHSPTLTMLLYHNKSMSQETTVTHAHTVPLLQATVKPHVTVEEGTNHEEQLSSDILRLCALLAHIMMRRLSKETKEGTNVSTTLH